MIDPPWPKKKGGIRKVRPNQGKDLDYKTMRAQDIFSLLYDEIMPTFAEDRNTVFLWTIDEYLCYCEEMMHVLGGYKRHARLIWDKGNGVAPCFSVRYSHEYLLWFYRPTFQPVDKSVRGKFTTVFREPAREHSRKPDQAYNMITFMFPTAKKIDIFSREKREGWDQWGNQINHFPCPQCEGKALFECGLCGNTGFIN